ncbi:MAG: CrcB family protein [Bdellovibrionia bacterium]
MKLISIGLFGLLGVFARYYLGILMSRYLPIAFPFGTLFINLSGAFLIGVVWVLGMEKAAIPHNTLIGIIVGFLGGFTTFSAYCLEFVRLIEESKFIYGILYVSLSPALGCLAAYFGMYLARL